MRSDVPVWVFWLGILIVAGPLVALIAGMTGSTTALVAFINTSGASWVQAVGSILALIAASSVATKQASDARLLENERRLTAELQKFEVIKALMARSIGLAKDVTHAFETGEADDFIEITPALMLDTSKTLQDLPIFEIPDGLLGLDVLSVGRALDSLAWHVEEFKRDVAERKSFLVPSAQPLHTLASELKEISEAAFADANRHIRDRKSQLGHG